ncbi:MAG: CehA/McbA family metallohydrolase [candidate division WOR-3 bacterium]
MVKHIKNFFLIFLFSFGFSLTSLEKDEILLSSKAKIQNGEYLIQFFLPKLKNSFYLNLKGLNQFKVFLNGERIGEYSNQSFTTIDLSREKNILKNKNQILIYSPEEGKVFSFSLWQSDYCWYMGTFHAHTNYSDGRYSVSQLLNMVNNEGGNFCAITDHDTLGQCYDTAFQRTGNCQPIRGTEWTSDSGHANILGPEGRNAFNKLSVRQMIDDATYRGGLVQINHPCDDELGMGWSHYPYLDPGIDAVEIFNGPTWFPKKAKSDDEAVMWWHQLLTQGKRIAAVGNSDYHGTMPGEDPLGAHSAVCASSDHPDTILKALKLGRVMVCDAMEDSRLYIYADTNNNNIMDLIMGENILIPWGSKRVKFRLEVDDADILDVVKVYSKSGEIYSHTLINGGDYEYEWTMTFSNLDTNFFRVSLFAWNGDYEYCTNPIYINYPEYELGPCYFQIQPLNLPETLYLNEEETLFFSLQNDGLVSPYQFGFLIAIETTGFLFSDWQRQGPGIGEVRHTPNLLGYEILEWRGGYPYLVRFSPQNQFCYWQKLRPKREGWQKIFYRSWADDRLFIIEKVPKIGFLGPDGEFWQVDSIFICALTEISQPQIEEREIFFIGPNPSKDKIKILIPSSFNQKNLFLIIYDIKGTLIKTFPLYKKEKELKLKELKEGVYFLILKNEEKELIKKIIISH